MRMLFKMAATGIVLLCASVTTFAAESDVTLRIGSYGGTFTAVQKKFVGDLFTERTGIKERRIAAEGLHDDVARRRKGGRAQPGRHLHAGVALGRHPAQRARIVHPQPHALPALGQVAGQPPAHADVAEVVDDAAEDVPQQRWDGRRRRRGSHGNGVRS